MSRKRDYAQIVNIYNEHGSIAAKDFIRTEYGIKQPSYILKVLKNDKGFIYDVTTNKYVPNSNENSDSIFLNLNELENKTTSTSRFEDQELTEPTEMTMKSMLSDLIQDRFVELSKYIALQQSLKTVSINMTAMKKAGYFVEIK